MTHKHAPALLCGDTAAHCLLLKDCSHGYTTVRGFAYVQDMRRLSPPCWNPLSGNVEHSRFLSLLLTPSEDISLPGKCTRSDTPPGRVRETTFSALLAHPHPRASQIPYSYAVACVSQSSFACPASALVSGQSRIPQAGTSSYGRT